MLATAIGPWWVMSPLKCEQDGIDVLVADCEGKRLIVGKCMYRESFDETAEFVDLEGKRDLVRGYHAEYLYLFMKKNLSAASTAKIAGCEDARVVTLEEMCV